jgi:hypothetical protein
VIATRPVLALDDLEAFDPGAPRGGRERRFCCPLEACAVKPADAGHRSLSLNVETGAWTCYRCGGSGQLREHWRPPAGRQREIARRALGLATAVVAAAPRSPPAPSSSWDWRALWDAATDLSGTPGQAYLARRGVPLDVAAAAGACYAPSWAGHPAVVFPVTDRAGDVQAAQGRYLRDDVTPTKRTGGPSKLGVFATPGALAADVVVVVEAPIDALSLHAAGVPAVALLGTNAPDWLALAVAFKRVALALDADAGGESRIDALAAQLGVFGATVERWRPAAKDWNDVLLQHGAAALREALTGAAAPADPVVDDVGDLLDGQPEEPPAAGADEFGSFLDEYADDDQDEEPASHPAESSDGFDEPTPSSVLVERVLTVFPPAGWRTVDDVAAELAIAQPTALVAVRALAGMAALGRSPRSRGGTGLWRRLAEPADEELSHA